MSSVLLSGPHGVVDSWTWWLTFHVRVRYTLYCVSLDMKTSSVSAVRHVGNDARYICLMFAWCQYFLHRSIPSTRPSFCLHNLEQTARPALTPGSDRTVSCIRPICSLLTKHQSDEHRSRPWIRGRNGRFYQSLLKPPHLSNSERFCHASLNSHFDARSSFSKFQESLASHRSSACYLFCPCEPGKCSWRSD